jgi:sterol desaturase/sphingolipid hydroxylase (fatty acid hydroxylase superfamily)
MKPGWLHGDWLLAAGSPHAEGTLYWSVFVVAFLGVAVWESIRPRAALREPAERRWGRHALLLGASLAFSIVLLPASPLLLAASVSTSPYGILNRAWLPFALRWIVAVLLLDFTRYAIHRAMHSFSWLWRLHQIHHSDRDFDASTGVRSHPFEGILVRGATLVAIALFAPPVSAVLVTELVSVFESFFTHANARLPLSLQRPLGWFFFTPNAHVIHHSIDLHLQNSNFGDILPWWDRLFGTYQAPLAESELIVIGLAESQHGPHPGALALLLQPFVAPRTGSNERSSAEPAAELKAANPQSGVESSGVESGKVRA